MRIEGKAWVFGDNIDTDVLAPGYAMTLPPDELAQHCLEAVDPSFAKTVERGDVIFAGRNFGLGSSREQAAISLYLLGVGAVLASSFARIFYRNALNIGLPVLTYAHAGKVQPGDRVRVEPAAGRVTNLRTKTETAVDPLPAHLTEMVEAGGLMAHIKSRLKKDPSHDAA